MKKFLLPALLFFTASYSYAAEKPVTTATFVNVYNEAADGDVLLLDAGEYSDPIAFPVGKAIILKVSPTAATQPVIKFQLVEPSGPDGSLTFDGLVIDRGGADYFFNSAATYDMNTWRFENCTIKDITRSLFNSTTQGGNISSFTIDKCLITACGRDKTSFIFSAQTIDAFTVSNSTIYKFVGGDFFKAANSNTTTKNISVSYINNTMYKCIVNPGYGWASINFVYPAGNTYLFRNNIFDSGANADPVANKPILVYRGNGTVTEENNIKINYGDNNNTPTNATNLFLDYQVLEGYTSIPYTDAENGILTIANNTPFATAGVGGIPVGNPYLIINVTPVTGLKVKATKVNQAVQIDWSTLSERGTSHFLVEKTIDGINFGEIGKVNAYGNSHQQQSYSFTDSNPNFGTNIYRIKSVDFDGEAAYSSIVLIDFENAARLSVFPNPTASILKVQTGSKNSVVSIYNLSGQKLLSAKVDKELAEFNVSDFSAGIYVVEVDNSVSKFMSRFMKK